MLRKSLFGILIFAASHTLVAADSAKQVSKLESKDSAQEEAIDVEAISEAFGNFLGKTLSNPENGIDLKIDKVIEGIRKGAAGKPSPLTEQEYQMAMIQIKQKALEAKAKENLDAAEAFLKKNKNQAEVSVIIEDKLQYQTLKEGHGTTVSENATPLIHYTGKFIDGTVFGSSEQTGPISIPLTQTIPGFRKGIAGMQEGEKRRLFIHPDLAYGKQGELPPNMLLIFDVEVVEADNAAAKTPSSEEDEDILEIDE